MDLRDSGRPAISAILVFLLSSLLATCPGCGGRRTRTSRPPMADGTTIGRDLRAAPAGSVLPATSLGVDMVDGSPASSEQPAPGRSTRDGRFATVGYRPDAFRP